MNSLLFALHLAAATAGTLESQQQNLSWSAWYGCWRAEGAPASEMVCITRGDAGVRVVTLVNGAVQDESLIVADGFARPVAQQGCTGTERARWSEDGRRVFLESELRCGNAERRQVRGMFAFVAPDEWISVQTATAGDSAATRVVHFLAVDPATAANTNAFSPARAVADVMFAVDEAAVTEAADHLGTEAVQEWMRAAGEPYHLGYTSQRGMSSALEQVGRLSNPVVVREVVHVVERPVYVHNTYVTDRYHWHYSPWGYHYHGWRWSPRPLIVVRLPFVIYRNTHYRSDYWRYRRHDRDRYDNWRYVDRRDDRDSEWRGGRATRGGYTSGRDRAQSNEVRTDRRANTAETTRRAARTQPGRTQFVRTQPARTQPRRAESARNQPVREQPRRVEPSRAEPSRAQPRRAEPSRSEARRSERSASGRDRASSSARAAPARSAKARGSDKRD